MAMMIWRAMVVSCEVAGSGRGCVKVQKAVYLVARAVELDSPRGTLGDGWPAGVLCCQGVGVGQREGVAQRVVPIAGPVVVAVSGGR